MAADIRKICAIFAYIWLPVVQAWAADLADPTRPPSAFSAAAPASARAAYPQVRGLQSVMVSPQHCTAIIDGKMLELGAMHGNERLVEINQHGVVLQGARGQRVLPLFPAVEMIITKALPANKPAAGCRLEQAAEMNDPAQQLGQREKK